MSFKPSDLRIGVLGGGQLGKMLAQEASKLDIELTFLDKSKDFPAGKVSPLFVEGDFNDYDTVMRFGKNYDIITIEIEHVNLQALFDLERSGKKVFPQPHILQMIQDKGLQKQYFLEHGYPTAPFLLIHDAQEIQLKMDEGSINYPFVQKTRTGGYDGKGVSIIKNKSNLDLLLPGPSVIEQLADIQTEISIIAVRNSQGDCNTYPGVSMDFHPSANLVEFLNCPAGLSAELESQAESLAFRLANELGIVGLLAVEMFVNNDGTIWINEMAPRPHNSGHHTLDNGATSQFANHIRAISGLPLGHTHGDRAAIMINLIGEKDYSGPVRYQGMESCLELDGVHLHLYGKSETKPFRKMGHITVTGMDLDECRRKANFVSNTIKVIS